MEKWGFGKKPVKEGPAKRIFGERRIKILIPKNLKNWKTRLRKEE